MDNHEIATKIVNDLLKDSCESVILAACIEEKFLRQNWGRAVPISVTKSGEVHGRPVIIQKRGVDIYGQEKPTDTKYFTCKLCERQVAANRFAAHVAKCATRSRRARPGTYV
ncbi:hypothetical protein DASB73_013450 [Starmerella bacillaris]|uniref:SAGA-associated factor 11 n=1 Tax=Starmerella bacillaris TaxID=1247836 RepID=A0AAV5RGQ9_STABA|nr:hypothetical protein DASB73_013450 [Starmerella bacillaris]